MREDGLLLERGGGGGGGLSDTVSPSVHVSIASMTEVE